MDLRTLIISPNNIDLKKKVNLVFLDMLVIWPKLLEPYLQYVGN